MNASVHQFQISEIKPQATDPTSLSVQRVFQQIEADFNLTFDPPPTETRIKNLIRCEDMMAVDESNVSSSEVLSDCDHE